MKVRIYLHAPRVGFLHALFEEPDLARQALAEGGVTVVGERAADLSGNLEWTLAPSRPSTKLS